MKTALIILMLVSFGFGCAADQPRADLPALPALPPTIHPKVFSMVTCWLSDTEQPVVTEINLDAVAIDRNQFGFDNVVTKGRWVVYTEKGVGGLLRYRALEPDGDIHRVLFQDNWGGGSLIVSTTIGYEIHRRNIATNDSSRSILVLKVVFIE